MARCREAARTLVDDPEGTDDERGRRGHAPVAERHDAVLSEEIEDA